MKVSENYKIRTVIKIVTHKLLFARPLDVDHDHFLIVYS